MNVLVTGSKGQLGFEIEKLATEFSNNSFFFTDVNSLDICNVHSIEEFVKTNKIQVIINCAAYTNVDGAENEEILAYKINVEAVKNLGEISKKYQVKLIHISTDYVFDGNSEKPYTENEHTNPKNNYGISKLKGEKVLLEINPLNTIIIRTAWLYSEHGNNFVKTILKLSKEKEALNIVNDQIGSPTYAKDLALVILKIISLIQNKKVEIYHYTNQGKCSWFEFATAIVALSNYTCKLVPVSSLQFKSKAKRPKFSLLNTEKIQTNFDIEIPNWKTSLKKCINKINKVT